MVLGTGTKLMRRREFITLLGSVAAWPLAARAQQQPGKLPLVALLVSGTPASHGLWVNAFAQRLRQLGWIEGRTVTIEYRWAEGDSARYAEIATELVQLKPSVIVTNGNAAVAAMKQVTSSIPIVFAVAGDPVGTGLVGSLARPGSNVTGLSIQQTDTATKRLELLRELLPHLRRLAIAANAANPRPRWRCATFGPQPKRSPSKPPPSNSGARCMDGRPRLPPTLMTPTQTCWR